MSHNLFDDQYLETLNSLRENSVFLSKQYLNPYSYRDVTDYVNSNILFSSFLMMMLHESGVTNADINERFNEVNIYFKELKDAGII